MWLILQGFRTHFPQEPCKTRSGLAQNKDRGRETVIAMRLEFHQLDRCYEHLRVHRPERQRRLLASLADSGQQTPIVVVAVAGEADR